MIRQFDVYAHPQPAHRAAYPYVVIVQHDGVPPKLNEVLAIPVSRPIERGARRLMPLLEIDGETMQVFTPLMRRVQTRSLAAPIANLNESRDRIIAAIDMLFVGS